MPEGSMIGVFLGVAFGAIASGALLAYIRHRIRQVMDPNFPLEGPGTEVDLAQRTQGAA